MITEIRNSFKTGGFKIVLWVMLLSMVVVFIPNLFKKGGEGYYATIATVNNKPIEFIEFQRKVYQETERLNLFRQQFGPQADMFLKNLGMFDPKVMAINGLINDALLDGIVQSIAISVSPEFITEKLHDPSYIMEELSDIIPYGVFDQQGINITLINHYLAQNKLSMKDFETKIENKIKRSMVLSLVAAAAYVPESQIKDYFIKNYLSRDYTIVSFPVDTYLKKVKITPLTEPEIASYFEKEHKRYWTPEKRSGTQWIFDPKKYGISMTQQDIESYYAHHKSQFLESPLQVQVRRILFKFDENDAKSIEDAQKQAEATKKELQAHPDRFEELARLHSQDETSASQGGLIPYFKKGEKDPEFERVALRLQKDGDVSEIVPTSEGLEIIQRVGRKVATYKPLAQVESSVKDVAIKQKFRTQFTEDFSKLMAIQNKENRAAAVQEFVKNKGARSEKINERTNDSSPFSEKLFKLRKDEFAYLFVDDQGVIMLVDTIEKSHKPELSLVKKDVEKDLYREKASELLKKDMEFAKGKPSATIKEKFPFVTIKQTGLLSKDDKKKVNDLTKSGISSDLFESLHKEGDYTTAEIDETGHLIGLTKVEQFNQESFNANKNIIANLLYDEQKQLVQKGFIASLYRNATINLTESLINYKEEQ